MKIKIHSGTHQIGGCVTEVTTENTRIIIDFGVQLSGGKGDIPLEQLYIEGVTYGAKTCDAVIFTHYHSDHVGRIGELLPNIPTYIGEAAKEILLLQQIQKKSGTVARIEEMKVYREGKKFHVGDMSITPIVADHSAFDAHMLLIEGEGKRVLHTGDFRTHGYRRGQMLSALNQIAGHVDVLITEGTNLLVKNPSIFPEYKLSETAEILMKPYKYVFGMCGAVDTDRLRSFYSASAGRSFLCNGYQKKLLTVGEKYGGDIYDFNRAGLYNEALIYDEFCMIVGKGKEFQKMMSSYTERDVGQCLFIYSMPDGYYRQHQNELSVIMDKFRYCVKLHTSGHGSREAIWQVANIVSPKQAVIPIHTTAPENIRLGGLQSKVIYMEDGDEYVI